MIGISNLVVTADNAGGKNNRDHNASRETTTRGDKGSRGSSDESRVEKASLKVAEANSKDVGRRIATIDPKVSEELGLLTGDVVEISSEKAKVSVLNWPSYQQDYGKGLIRIDGYVRNRLDVGVNDKVEIRKIETKDAKSITLAPTEPLRILGAEEYLATLLVHQIKSFSGNKFVYERIILILALFSITIAVSLFVMPVIYHHLRADVDKFKRI
jgi:hypothetical protein